jgi:putative endonuclease
MTIARQQLGKLGEDLACDELERRGHVIVERGYRTTHGELDIVSTHNGYTVFVEVKTKSADDFGEPAEAVTSIKQQKLVWMATDYVARHRLENSPCRFDVVAVESEFHPPRVTVFEDAFRPGW